MRRRVVFRLVTLLGVLVVCLVLLEAGLRLCWTGYYRKEPGMRSRRSATLGSENRPSVTFRYGEPEYTMDVRHNALGFRGPEVAAVKAAGRVRVLALGDSFTYGMGVEERDTFCARLEALDPRLEVLNAGVQGYGTSQEYLLLVEKGAALAPDVVLVCFFWNDLANNLKAQLGLRLEADGTVARGPPPAALRRAAEDAAREGRERDEESSALAWSYAYRFLSDRLKGVRIWMKVEFGGEIENPDRLRPEQLDDAWRWQRALFAAIAREAAAAGARPVIVVIPDQVQVHTDVEVVGLADHFLDVQPRIAEIGRELGVPVVDLLPGLRDAAARTGVALYHRYDRHLNAAGHGATAQVLLDALRRLGVAPATDAK